MGGADLSDLGLDAVQQLGVGVAAGRHALSFEVARHCVEFGRERACSAWFKDEQAGGGRAGRMPRYF